MWWGYSPALDVLEEYETAVGPEPRGAVSQAEAGGHEPGPAGDVEPSDRCEGSLDVLVLGGADGRHVLRTTARRWRRPDALRRCHLRWHLAEPLPELCARQLLLLSVALAPSDELGPRQRVRLFLEIYGNALLRARTAAFLAMRGAQLARVVANADVLRMQLGATLEPLRHRERDHIQDTCLLWRSPPARLSMASLWDERVRRHLGTRYDSRQGVFDWDYHMRLKEMSDMRIAVREYKHWRDTGVAFTWLETECALPNASLLSWVERAHGEIRHRGYCGDIESGPYPAFGNDCEDDPDFDKICNGIRIKTSTDIAERNLDRMFFELRYGVPFEPPEECDDRTVYITELPAARDDWVGVGETLVTDFETLAAEGGVLSAEEGERQKRVPSQPVPPLRCFAPRRQMLSFLPQDALIKYPHKPRHRGVFDVIIFAQGLSHWMKPEVVSMARPGALLLVEGKRWVVSARKKAVEEHAQTVAKRAKECGCAPVGSYDPLSDDYAIFRVQRDEAPSSSQSSWSGEKSSNDLSAPRLPRARVPSPRPSTSSAADF